MVRASLNSNISTNSNPRFLFLCQELEESVVKNVHDEFQRLYVPPLGPLDDPPGVIYLDGDPNDKTVDVGVLEEVGENVLEARKKLFDICNRRRSLVDDIKAQNRRVRDTNIIGRLVSRVFSIWHRYRA